MVKGLLGVLGSVLLAGLVVGCGADHGAADATHGGEAPQGEPSSRPIVAVSGPAVYVVNGEDATVSVLRPDGAVVGTIALTNVAFPHHVYLSPDRSRLSVAVPGHDLSGGHSAKPAEHGAEHGAATGAPTSKASGAVLVLDASTGATIKSRRLDSPNHNAIFSPNGNEIWTALLIDQGEVLVLDAQTLVTKETIRVGRTPAEVTFSPDGKRAFVANGSSNDITVIDVDTKKVVKTIPVDAEPVGAWPGADGRMYVDCEVAKTIRTIDTKSLEAVQKYDLGFTPGFAAVPPGRTAWLWLTDTDAGKIVLNKTASDTKTSELVTAPGAHALAFAPDGSRAYVTNQLSATVSIIDVATRTIVATVPVGKKPNGVVFRP